MELIDHFEGEYFFLSNFYPVPILFDGVYYPTIEHSFQAAKTIVQNERIPFQAHGLTPGQSKRLGRQITLRADWEEVKNDVMREQLAYKFGADHHVLQRRLIDTGEATLIEGNRWHDNVWGDCYCNQIKTLTEVKESCHVPGQNRLGKLLMELRAHLSKEQGESC